MAGPELADGGVDDWYIPGTAPAPTSRPPATPRLSFGDPTNGVEDWYVPSTSATGNVFDQFDTAPASRSASGPATGSSGNIFDQFDGPSDAGSAGRPSALTRVGAGINSGLISQSLGAPVDFATGAMNLVPRAINTVGQAFGHDPAVPLIENPIGGSEWFDTQLGKAGIGTKGIAPPENAAERIEQAAGQGIGGMLAPNMLAKGRALSGILGVGRDVEEALAAGSVPANAGIGGISGAGGQSAAEVAPPGYQVPAYLLGSLVPGGALGLSSAGVSALGRGTANLYRNMPPFTAASREAAAGAGAANRVRAAASDPTAAFETAANAQPELVPGSLPTFPELSGDPGLLSAQKLRESNSADFGRETLERRAGNATAQMAHLEGQAPPLASVEDTQAALRQHLADIDATGDQAAQAASTNAAQALPVAGMTPEETGAAARTAVEAERAPQGAALAAGEAGAQSRLSFASDQFGGQAALGSPEEQAAAPAQYGAAMREPAAAAYAAERKNLDALRATIDPTGTMGMRPDAMKAAVGKIGEMFPAEGGAQLSGPERSLYDTVSNWGDLIPVERAFQMRANINGRIRGLQGSDPQEALRLGVLKKGVDDALPQAVEHVDVGERAGLIHEGLPGIGERVADVAPKVGSTVYTPTGRPMDVRYELADLAAPNAPVVSHDIEGTPNAAYPQELQPRDRSRAANAVQVRRMAGQLQPERLGASVSAGEGAPIVGPDNMVESGNGRMLALRHAYDERLPTADRYRAFLEQQGYDTTGLRQPVLLRRRVSEMSPDERLAAVREANAPTVARMGAAEQAATDARKLNRDLLSSYRGGSLARAENRPFVREFMKQVPSPGEEGALATPEGALSLKGERRISNALLHRAYGDSRLVSALTEAGDENVRTFGGALTDAAGEMARLRADTEAGRVPQQFDLSNALTEAARVVQTARSRGVPLADFVAQRDAFNPISTMAERFLGKAYGDQLSGRVSRASLADYVQRYAQEAQLQSAEPQMFGDAVTPERILEAVGEQYGQSTRSFGRNRSSGTVLPGEGGGVRGTEARGPGGASAGAEGSGERPPAGIQAETGSFDRPLTPLTPEAKQTFADWNSGYKQMGQTYRGETPGTLHPVGKMLQKGRGAFDSYNLTDEQVPWLFVNRGANGRQGAERFLAAAPPEAHGALDDALAFSLRQAAQNPDGTINLPKYEKWRINHQGVMSTRPELAKKFGNAAQAQKQLDDIRASLAQHAADHPLKPGWGDAGLLNRYFKAGPEGAEKMREYQRITGSRPGALDAAADHAAFSFAQAAVRDGEVNPRLAEIWLRNHDEALSAMPGLHDKFTHATEAQKTLEKALEAHQTARDEFTKSVAGKFLTDDPDKAIARVFTGANREQKAKLLTDLVRSDKAAAEGLQRAAIGYIRAKFEGPRVPGSEEGGLPPKAFGDFVRENRGVLAQLFPGKMANFDALSADLKRGAQVQGAKINKAGSDTAELTAGRGEPDDHGGDIGQATMMLMVEHAAQHAGHHIVGGAAGAAAGPVAAGAAVAGRMFVKRARNALAVRESELFDRALLDPKFAMDINRTNPATRHETPESIGARLRGRIVQQSLMSARGMGLQ